MCRAAASCAVSWPAACAPGGPGARRARRQAITALPAGLARTITWDQGIEMACHAGFTITAGIPVCFCDPHAPWQRGSNENIYGLLRQYLPKGTDLSLHSAVGLARIAASLNGRPRRTLGYMTPSGKLPELFAQTG
jgi:IS30 family transposase